MKPAVRVTLVDADRRQKTRAFTIYSAYVDEVETMILEGVKAKKQEKGATTSAEST